MIDIYGVDDLDDFIIENTEKDNVIMLYFGATWCGPCKQLKKKLSEPETFKIMPKLAVAHLDVDDEVNEKLVKRYKVSSLPTQILIKLDDTSVVEVSRIVGYDFTKLKMEYDNYLQ
jgi:thiol-disulfide isomerase/thioredoxin